MLKTLVVKPRESEDGKYRHYNISAQFDNGATMGWTELGRADAWRRWCQLLRSIIGG